jgi:fatty acyl-CoA reductase
MYFSGVLTGAGAGVIRSIHGNGNLVSDLIPCDFVVNCIVAAGACVASNPSKEFKVYNCTSSTLLPITWNEFLDTSK